jgi:hypothetical protein
MRGNIQNKRFALLDDRNFCVKTPEWVKQELGFERELWFDAEERSGWMMEGHFCIG